MAYQNSCTFTEIKGDKKGWEVKIERKKRYALKVEKDVRDRRRG